MGTQLEAKSGSHAGTQEVKNIESDICSTLTLLLSVDAEIQPQYFVSVLFSNL